MFRNLTLAIAALAVSAPGYAKTIHTERSLYRNIFVTQEGQERCMLFRTSARVGRQSCILLNAPNRHVFDYTRMMMAGLFLNPRPSRILVIGLGGGTIPRTLQQMYPNASLDVVEIDPAVGRVALSHFGFQPGKNTRLIFRDGRVFVKRQQRSAQKYDLVMLDAFDGDYIPEHLLTAEFLKELHASMAPGGVIVANTFASSGLYDHESTTYASVFGRFYNMKRDNRVVVGRKGGLLPANVVKSNASALAERLAPYGINAGGLLGLMSTRVDWDTSARVLTDQYSPSNVLNARRRGG